MSDDIRKFISLVESKETLTENPFTRILAAMGHSSSQGKNERDKLIKTMRKSWNQWIGKTGLPGNMNDMKHFLYNIVGFEPNEISKILGSGSNVLDRSRSDQAPDNEISDDSVSSQENTGSEESSDNRTTSNSEPSNDNTQGTRVSNDNEQSPRVSNDNAQEPSRTQSKHSLTVKFNNVNSFLKNSMPAFLRDPGDEELLSNMDSGITLASTTAKQMMNHDPVLAKQQANILIKYLETLVSRGELRPNDKRVAQNKIQALNREFNNTRTTEDIIFNYIMAENGIVNEATGLSLSSSQINDILDSAARFIFVNDLLGNRAPSNNASSDNDSEQPQQQTNVSNSTPRQETKPNASVMANLRKLGLGQSDVENLTRVVKDRNVNYTDLASDDAKAIQAVGWAFLKTLNY